jgi:DNA-binding GntR family transcriptional regulator
MVRHGVLPTITVEAVTERVTQSLRDAIIGGVLQPGERLIEERIAAQMGVSRAPIREALRSLEAEGLVRSLPRRGLTVIVLTKQDVEEIYGLRSALECQAARSACRKLTPDDLEELRSLVRRMREAGHAGDRQALADHDIALHRKILEVSGNGRLLKAWLAIMSQVRLLQRRVVTAPAATVDGLVRHHEAIVEGLRSGDPDTAVRPLREHIERTGHEVFESFPEVHSEGR